MLESRFHPFLSAAAALASSLGTASAQQYTVTRIDPPPDAYITIARGMNDQGHVVGYAYFSGVGPAMRAWVWRPETGLEFLPQPAGQSNWLANDINESGVICGDGGFDGGLAWRFEDGVYEFLGFLPTGDMSTSHAIDEAGRVACTSRDSLHFSTPPIAFLSVPGEPPQPIATGAYARFLNDAGQLVGYTTSNQAFRAAADGTVQMLGGLPGKPLSWAAAINAHGDVVGDAAQANGNGHVPFLFTDAGGMQEIGDFGGSAKATSINDERVVVGDSGTTVPKPWAWSAKTGVLLLGTAIDPAEQLNLLEATRINDAGQVLCRAISQVTGDRFPVILTPAAAAVPWVDLGGGLEGTLGVPALAGALVAGDPETAELQLAQAPPHAPVVLAFGTASADVPLLGGVLVPDVLAPGGGVLVLATDGDGSIGLAAPWPHEWPSGVQLLVQAWVVDGGAAQGVSASNALASPQRR